MSNLYISSDWQETCHLQKQGFLFLGDSEHQRFLLLMTWSLLHCKSHQPTGPSCSLDLHGANPSHMTAIQIFKEAKSSLLQGKHCKFLKRMPKRLSLEPLSSPGHTSWMCSRVSPGGHLLKHAGSRKHVGINSKMKFLKLHWSLKSPGEFV